MGGRNWASAATLYRRRSSRFRNAGILGFALQLVDRSRGPSPSVESADIATIQHRIGLAGSGEFRFAALQLYHLGAGLADRL